jgi:hypothetical protein
MAYKPCLGVVTVSCCAVYGGSGHGHRGYDRGKRTPLPRSVTLSKVPQPQR